MDHLTWLTRWYAKHCDGYWEHAPRVKIETVDNPGWTLKIDLEETELEGRPFESQRSGEVSEEYDPTKVASWWVCRVEKSQFYAACGAHDLETIISIFRDWAERQDS
jgi:hypothetical protein